MTDIQKVSQAARRIASLSKVRAKYAMKLAEVDCLLKEQRSIVGKITGIAAALKPGKNTLKMRILEVLKDAQRPLTASEISEKLEQFSASIAPTLHWLKNAGLVIIPKRGTFALK